MDGNGRANWHTTRIKCPGIISATISHSRPESADVPTRYRGRDSARDESGRFRSDGRDANYFERAPVTGTTSSPRPALLRAIRQPRKQITRALKLLRDHFLNDLHVRLRRNDNLPRIRRFRETGCLTSTVSLIIFTCTKNIRSVSSRFIFPTIMRRGYYSPRIDCDIDIREFGCGLRGRGLKMSDFENNSTGINKLCVNAIARVCAKICC